MSPLKGELGKGVAVKGKVDIAPKYIHGGEGYSRVGLIKERLKSLPKYVRRYPGRFGLGAAMALGGGGLIGYGGKRLLE
jgi:hypothetical protein